MDPALTTVLFIGAGAFAMLIFAYYVESHNDKKDHPDD